MTTLVSFLEEPSAQAMLESFLPQILPDGFEPQFVVFEGKSDLNKRLVRRLKAWQKPDCHFIILRDQDSADCVEVKAVLRQKCEEGNHPEALVRIACHELESWYLGDLQAVGTGLNLNNMIQYKSRAKYRDPDRIAKPSQELSKITRQRYQKVAGSREIGKHLDMTRNRSHSFRIFLNGLTGLWGN